MAQPTSTRVPPTVDVKRLAAYGLFAGIVAILVNGLVRQIALAVGNLPNVFPLSWGPVIASTTIGVIGGTVAYGVILRIANRPNRTFKIVAVVVLLLSFIGPVNMFLSPPPTIADTPASVYAILSVMHVTTAGIVVGAMLQAGIESDNRSDP